MGLDARVYCECFERGMLRAQPQPEWQVYVDDDGSRATQSKGLEQQMAFDRWNWKDACEHEDGVLLGRRLGNIALIGFFRDILTKQPKNFPIMLGKVIYNGCHCGDFIGVDEVRALEAELTLLSRVHGANSDDEQFLRDFEKSMRELAECSVSVGKPLVF
jgi:hypothetical protein